MKKIFNITIIIFFLCNNLFANTFYCNSDEWKESMVINVDFENNFVQHPTFRNGEKYKAEISDEEIFFDIDGEHWIITRKNGKFLRKNFNLEIYQEGSCSKKIN